MYNCLVCIELNVQLLGMYRVKWLKFNKLRVICCNTFWLLKIIDQFKEKSNEVHHTVIKKFWNDYHRLLRLRFKVWLDNKKLNANI